MVERCFGQRENLQTQNQTRRGRVRTLRHIRRILQPVLPDTGQLAKFQSSQAPHHTNALQLASMFAAHKIQSATTGHFRPVLVGVTGSESLVAILGWHLRSLSWYYLYGDDYHTYGYNYDDGGGLATRGKPAIAVSVL